MATITEDFVSFETAKLLKEKGFNEPTKWVWYERFPSSIAFNPENIGKPKRDYFYSSREGESNSSWVNSYPIPSYTNGEVYSYPTHQMAMKWLREEHNLHIGIARGPKGYHITIETIPLGVVKYITIEIVGTTYVDSYEEAVEAALKYTLENLI